MRTVYKQYSHTDATTCLTFNEMAHFAMHVTEVDIAKSYITEPT